MSRRSRLFNERGITLAEVLIAAAVLGLGLAALMAVVPVASYAIQDGNQTSTATYLAQQRLEQVRNALWTAAADCVGLSDDATSEPEPFPPGQCGATAVTFPDEAATWPAACPAGQTDCVPGFPQYARSVRISDCGVTACDGIITHSAMRLVRVTVTYRPISAAGSSNLNTSVTLEWLVAQRL
jgi:type II secretory pathway pseudopilin PulG